MAKIYDTMIQVGRRRFMGPILLLTLALTTFIQGGIFLPNEAAADVQILSDWSNLHNATSVPGTLAYPMTAGNNRMLVVAVSGTLTAAATQTLTVTYGTQSLTKQVTNETTSARNHVWLFYLNEAKIKAATNSNLVFTNSGGTVRFYQVNAAVFSDVDQSATPISSSQVWNNDGTAASTFGPFGTALSIGTNERAVEIAAVVRYAGTTPRTLTIASPWAQSFGPTTLASTDSINVYMNHDTTAGTTTSQFTASNTTNGSMAAMSIKPYSAPVAGSLSVTPLYGTMTNGSPTLSATFTSTASAISGCQYTTDGTTWSTATLSGTQPNYTCTATPTGLSGTKTFNLQATNPGGTTQSTPITLTVDATAPVDGTLTLLTGYPDVGILWAGATETGSGLGHYDVYFQAGPTAPACGAGTLIYTGKWLNFTHTGRTASTQYSYRVCATDNVGNVSTGIVGTITTAARPSTVNTCSACHGNPPVDNAARVGGTTGQFPGSHNTHSGSGAGQYGMMCTNCHTNNTTMAHANGNIDIVLNTGTYSLGSHAVSNTVSPGNCSNTYCHSNGTGGTTQSGDTRPIATNTSPNWGGTKTCYTCHGTSADIDGRPQYATGSPKSNDHLKATHAAKACTVCHDSILSGTSGSYVMDPAKHNAGTYSIKASMGYTYAVGGGTCATSGCHVSAQWGVTTLGCVQCHAATITRTVGRAAGTTLANVVGEFGLAWGHKKTGRAAVSDDDCIVCHLEGNGTTHKTTSYHMDGNIDLRDPDGAGETPITDMNNAAWTFQRYSTTFAAGSRTATGHTANTIANIVTQKFCVKCHDSNGATNTTARSNNGGTATQYMPFGGIALGATYTAANNATGTQGLIDVATQFATGNSGRHPVLAPLTRDFPYSTRLASPYNNIGTARDANGTTGHTTALSVVIYCDDCHNAPALKTLRTVTAHGSDANSYLRGTIYATQPTLCTGCHTGYTTSGNHGTGSAWGATGSSHNASQNCHYCHGSNTSTTAPTRPTRAQDYHGHNALVGGGLWPTANARPVAFIRGWSGTAYHRAYTLSGTNGYTANTGTSCGSGTCPGGGTVGNGQNPNYTAGGTY